MGAEAKGTFPSHGRSAGGPLPLKPPGVDSGVGVEPGAEPGTEPGGAGAEPGAEHEADPAERVRHGPVIGAPPPDPGVYDASYTLPMHREKSLQVRHPHPRDARICFYKAPHVYTVDGRCVGVSASSLLHGFVEEFDAARTLAGMQAGRAQAWPRLRYAAGAAPTTPALLDAARAAGEDPLVLVVAPGNVGKTTYAGCWSACPAAVGLRSGLAPGSELFTFERALTDAEVHARWADPEACNRGIEAHAMMELWCNSEPARVDDAKGAVGLGFVRAQLAPRGFCAYRIEWEIFAEEEDVAGSVDFSGLWPDGRLVLVDWKRTPKLEEHLRTHFRKKMKWPLGHLDDCDGAKYAIQLSIYAWILEKYYGVRVHGLALCSLHPDAPFHTWVPYLRLECLWATRDAAGELCDEKVARIAGEAAKPCALARATCAEALLAVSPNARVPREATRLKQGAVSWARQMPASGIRDPCTPRA